MPSDKPKPERLEQLRADASAENEREAWRNVKQELEDLNDCFRDAETAHEALAAKRDEEQEKVRDHHLDGASEALQRLRARLGELRIRYRLPAEVPKPGPDSSLDA